MLIKRITTLHLKALYFLLTQSPHSLPTLRPALAPPHPKAPTLFSPLKLHTIFLSPWPPLSPHHSKASLSLLQPKAHTLFSPSQSPYYNSSPPSRRLPHPLPDHDGGGGSTPFPHRAGYGAAYEDGILGCMEPDQPMVGRYWHRLYHRVFLCRSLLQCHYRLVLLLPL